MPIDVNTFPISGRLVLTVLLWVVVSAFALGPLVARRSIETLHWGEVCAASLTDQAGESRPAENHTRVRCADVGHVVDSLLGDGIGQSMCSAEVGGTITGLIDLARRFDPAAQAQERARAEAERQMAQEAALAPTRCACAADLVASDQLRWGLYAGSGRMLGKGTETLMSDLTQALHQPHCALKPMA